MGKVGSINGKEEVKDGRSLQFYEALRVAWVPGNKHKKALLGYSFAQAKACGYAH